MSPPEQIGRPGQETPKSKPTINALPIPFGIDNSKFQVETTVAQFNSALAIFFRRLREGLRR